MRVKMGHRRWHWHKRLASHSMAEDVSDPATSFPVVEALTAARATVERATARICWRNIVSD